MTNAFFITGTGTEIGKTIVTCSLARQLRKSNYNVAAIKPIISGWNNEDFCDTKQILTSLEQAFSQENIEKTSPWRFNAPLAPSIAAKLEDREINYLELVNFCNHPPHPNPLPQGEGTRSNPLQLKEQENINFLICEGAGGVIVPLNNNKTTLDLMQDLQFQTILVAGSYLGAMSHTLTAIKTLESVSVKIKAIIVNESVESVGLNDTVHELKKFTHYPIYKLRRVVSSTGFIWENTDNLLKCLF